MVDGRRCRQTNELSSDRLQYKKKVYPVHYGYIILTFEKNMNMQVMERRCIVHKLTLTETDTVMCTNAPGSCAHTSLFINIKIVSYRYTHCVSLPLPSFFSSCHSTPPTYAATFYASGCCREWKAPQCRPLFLISSTPRLTPLPTCLSRRSTRPRLITFG